MSTRHPRGHSQLFLVHSSSGSIDDCPAKKSFRLRLFFLPNGLSRSSSRRNPKNPPGYSISMYFSCFGHNSDPDELDWWVQRYLPLDASIWRPSWCKGRKDSGEYQLKLTTVNLCKYNSYRSGVYGQASSWEAEEYLSSSKSS